MIVCPVCQKTNGHLAVVCVSCGSFLQAKVDTLDLFATTWQLIESPRKAFYRIALASHKNYIVFLGAAAGIAFAFTLFWMLSIGNSGIPLANVLIAGFVLGPVLGIFSLLLLGLLQKITAKIFGFETKYKNALAIIAYACIPVVLSVIFVFPIEILTFGKFFFSTNPSPYTLKPVSYVLVLGLDGACLLWALVLYTYGTKVLYNVSMLRAMFISGITVGVFASIVLTTVVTLSLMRVESGVDKYFASAVVVYAASRDRA